MQCFPYNYLGCEVVQPGLEVSQGGLQLVPLMLQRAALLGAEIPIRSQAADITLHNKPNTRTLLPVLPSYVGVWDATGVSYQDMSTR